MKQQLNKTFLKGVLATAVVVTLLTGCGSGGDGPVQPAPVSASQGVVDYILALIKSSTSDMGDPISLDGVTLATDDLADAVAL